MNNIRINNRAGVSLSDAINLVGAVISSDKVPIGTEHYYMVFRYGINFYRVEVKTLKKTLSYTITKQKKPTNNLQD